MAPAADVARGVVLDDRYSLEDVIGQGGMATVYRARDEVLGRHVAIKLFPPVAENADDLLRHQAEMRVLAQMSHPGLVTLHDAGSAYAGGPMRQTFLVMELVHGPTLAERLARGALDPAHTALVGRQVAEALAAVHSADVVHRDVKPANVLLVDPDALAQDGVTEGWTGPIVKLADFGIARLSDGARLTVTGTTLGTATYLSPEQAAGGVVGPATDVYALGLVLLECLTGQKAFTGTMIEVAAARLNTSPAIPADLGQGWVNLLTAMTRRDPEERLSAREVALRLTAILAGSVDDSAAGVNPPPPVEVEVAARRRTLRGAADSRPPSERLRTTRGGTDGAEQERPGTRQYSTAEIQAAAEAFTREALRETSAEERPSRVRWDRRSRRPLVGAAALVLAVSAVAATQLGAGTPEPVEPPSYPSVEGTLGSALDALQRSVEP